MRIRIFTQRILAVGIILSVAVCVSAGEMAGKVLDVFGSNVTVQCDGKMAFQKGDGVDLLYMAGVMEMLIGRYEVVEIKDNVFIGKAVSSSMPPMKEMNVRVVKAGGTTEVPVRISHPPDMGPDPAAMDPAEMDPRFLQANQQGTVVFPSVSPVAIPTEPDVAVPIEKVPAVPVLGPQDGAAPGQRTTLDPMPDSSRIR